MNKQIEELLAKAERRLRQYGEMAYLSYLSMPRIWTSDTPYGATDSRTLFLNPDGLAKLAGSSDPVGYTAFLLFHEALHAMLRHPIRCRDMADRETANIAVDYLVNALIDQVNRETVGLVPFPIIEGAYLDHDLSDGHDALSLYHFLLADKPEESDESGESGDESGESGESGDESGESADESGSGSKPSDPDDLSDIHSGDFFDPDLKGDETVEDFDRSVNETIEQNAAQIEMDKIAGIGGSDALSKAVADARDQFQKIDWRDHLSQWLSSSIAGGEYDGIDAAHYSGTGLVEDERSCRNVGELVVIIDTSGSVVNDDPFVTSALDQIETLSSDVAPKKIHVVHVDYMVRHHEELNAGDPVDRELHGGWGTLFKPAFDWVEENAPDAKGIVYITDGFASDWEELEEPSLPVLWLDYGYYLPHYKFGEVATMYPEK
jgi:predicted metal-dependent peptidase